MRKDLTGSVRRVCGALVMMCASIPWALAAVHPDFVMLSEIVPLVQQSVRYATSENFLGRPVVGYTLPEIASTRAAARALAAVQEDLKAQGFELVVYDGYRPQRSVDEFIAWSRDMADQAAKNDYYPTIDKANIFDLGYLVMRSSHSRGSTFDVSLIPLGQKYHSPLERHPVVFGRDVLTYLDDGTLDMGTSFDTFHEASHHDSPLVSEAALANRQILRAAMQRHGFKDYHEEWWHYTLNEEPYPATYFDFVVESPFTVSEDDL